MDDEICCIFVQLEEFLLMLVLSKHQSVFEVLQAFQNKVLLDLLLILELHNYQPKKIEIQILYQLKHVKHLHYHLHHYLVVKFLVVLLLDRQPLMKFEKKDGNQLKNQCLNEKTA